MLHFSNDNAITGFESMAAIAVSYQINGFGGAFDKNNLFGRGCVNKASNLTAHRFHLRSRFCAQGMNAAMNRRIALTIEVKLSINNYLWFLRTGSTVQIRQRLSVNFTAKQWKISSDLFDTDLPDTGLSNRETHSDSPANRCAMRANTTLRMDA
ncbi:Uncharacterised protein [Yersinia enterocolitica]|nr:Uncharacterised protein [Yersinia enterocolitica]